jgi:hypothetical protein
LKTLGFERHSTTAAAQILISLRNERINSDDDKRDFQVLVEMLRVECTSLETLPSASLLCTVVSELRGKPFKEISELIQILSTTFVHHYSDSHNEILLTSLPNPLPTSSEICKAISGMRDLPLEQDVTVQQLLKSLYYLLSITVKSDQPSAKDLKSALQGVKAMPSDVKVVSDTAVLLSELLSPPHVD